METEGNLLQKMKNVFSDNEDKEKIAEEIIEKVLEGYEKGVLTRREMKMITNIFEYMDSDAKDIMTHRKNIVALDGEESLEKALTFMLEENKSRFPVYEEQAKAAVKKDYEERREIMDASPIHVAIAGRMMFKRVMGKASFCNIQDLPLPSTAFSLTSSS